MLQRRAAMSSPAAAAIGLVAFLLSLRGADPAWADGTVQSQRGCSVSCSETHICAIKGAKVVMMCTCDYSSGNSNKITLKETNWFTKLNGTEPVDLRTDPEYSDRVQYTFYQRTFYLQISDVRESDSAEYKFRLITNPPAGSTCQTGVTLSVTVFTDPDLQVQVETSRYFRWATLTCKSRCSLPDPSSFVWFKNGNQISGKTESLFKESFDNADSYSCAVRGFEAFPAPLVCVRGSSCYNVRYSRRTICAPKGSTVDISCSYSSYTMITDALWVRSDRWPEDLTKSSQYKGRVSRRTSGGNPSYLRISYLTISDLRDGDSAEYRFRFTARRFEWRNSFPGTSLRVTALQVQVTRCSGPASTEAELRCRSSCSPEAPPSFVWFRNEQEVPGVETSAFRSRIFPRDVISCALREHKDHRSPAVYAPTGLSVSPNHPTEIKEGAPLTLTCSADANPAASYSWYRLDGEEDLLPLSQGEQLIFSSIQSSASGSYCCAAENELGKTTSRSISIAVRYAPKLPSVSVSPAEILEGRSVNLTCSSDANPAANYTWYKDNQTLIHGAEGVYHFPSISSEDSGSYRCQSENQYGAMMSSPRPVDVQYAPKLPSVSVSPAEILEGRSVTLSCSSDANPAANYTWYKENEDSPKGSGPIFTITEVRAEHSGNYSCEAQNGRGRRTSTFYLIAAAASVKSAVVGSITAFVLVVAFLSAFLLIRRKRRQTTQRPDSQTQPNVPRTPAEDQGNLCYASIRICKNQEDPLYSNIGLAQPRRHRTVEEEEEEARGECVVEYSSVNVHNAGSSSALKHQEEAVDEDPCALYSTVTKTQGSEEDRVYY